MATKKTATPVSREAMEQARAILSSWRVENPSARSTYGQSVQLVVKPKTPVDRLPRQARIVLEVLANGKFKGKASQADLEAAVTPILATAGYRQDGHRIYTFYRKQMIERGFITVS